MKRGIHIYETTRRDTIRRAGINQNSTNYSPYVRGVIWFKKLPNGIKTMHRKQFKQHLITI